jgi:hypothetical protein
MSTATKVNPDLGQKDELNVVERKRMCVFSGNDFGHGIMVIYVSIAGKRL